MYQDFGASVNENIVTFQLFFPDNSIAPDQYTRGGLPNIQEIRIRGSFQEALRGNNWDLDTAPIMVKQSHPKGHIYTWSCSLPEGFYEYKYFVTFNNGTTRWCTDPCSKYGCSDESENSAFVVGGQDEEVLPLLQRLAPKDWVIYELMIDDFTAEFRGEKAPLDAIREKLDYLQDLGINAIEFMPWTAWPGGEFSWGYDPFQFFSVEHRYSHDIHHPLDKLYKLKSLINELHRRNIHVIMDGVFNHVRAGVNPNRGFGYQWLYQNPEDSPYIGDFERGGFFEEFDYDNRCTQEFIRDICIYWLEEFQIDGIRFDYTLGFYREGESNVGIAQLIREVKAYLKDKDQENVGLFIEHLTDNRFEAIDDTNQINADGCWFDPFMFSNWDSAQGRMGASLLRVLDAGRDYGEGKGPVTYVQNHDHSNLVTVLGGREQWYKGQAPAIALLTSPGTVMLHNGQEFGEDYFLPDTGPGRVLPRPLRWEVSSTDFIGSRLYTVYQRLIAIRQAHPSLRSANFFPRENHPDGYGVFPDQGIAIYHRWGDSDTGETERFIIVLNYSTSDRNVDIPFSTNGAWTDLLNEERVNIENHRLSQYRIPSHWGRIFYQEG